MREYAKSPLSRGLIRKVLIINEFLILGYLGMARFKLSEKPSISTSFKGAIL